MRGVTDCLPLVFMPQIEVELIEQFSLVAPEDDVPCISEVMFGAGMPFDDVAATGTRYPESTLPEIERFLIAQKDRKSVV